MERRLIHPKGPVLSRIISGAWRWHKVNESTVDQLIRVSLDNGITTFDNADIYGDHLNEEIFGSTLRKDPSLRKQMEIITKCGIKFPSQKRPVSWVKHYDTSAKHITWSVENSLKLFNTDYLDLLLIHRPDPLLDPEEVAEVFTQLQQNGKVLHFGVSNFTSFQFEMLQSYLSMPLVTNQIEISITNNSPLFDGTVDVLMKNRTSPLAWSPLGGGSLMDEKHTRIFEKAPVYNASPAQMSIAWLLKHPSKIFPVIGTTQPGRISESAAASQINLDLQDWFDMLKGAMGKEMP
jgi:predicted oxidoreductase